MKLQYKAALLFFLFNIFTLGIGILSYDYFADQRIIEKTGISQFHLTDELALHIESHLEEKAANAMALANTPLLRKALRESNKKYEALDADKRKNHIDALNRRWMETDSIHDPFILSYMKNSVADHLKSHQQLFPHEFGEIFLTNRYGTIIATTKKLTTLAHAHKYWWLASYNGGKGKIFLDDRGFDTSVSGYVLGVVIPIIEKSELLGVLKCNINILGPLSHMIKNFGKSNYGSVKLVRAGGLVVYEKDQEPLSTKIDEKIIQKLKTKKKGSTIIDLDDKLALVSYSPIMLTLGSNRYGFGGKGKSIDQLKGNLGEAWHTVIIRERADVLKASHASLINFAKLGIMLSFAVALLAFLIGKMIARPIVIISEKAKIIGQGNLDVEIRTHSRDEFGILALSFNQMAKNLKKITASKEQLDIEINERKEAEAALQLSEANLKRAQKVGKMGSWHIDLRDGCLEWSDEVYRICNVSKGKTVAYEDFLALVHPDDRESVSAAWEAALDKGPYDIEHRIVVDGTDRWVREIAEIEFNQDGKALRGIGTIQDITVRKNAEKEREKIIKELQNALEEVKTLQGFIPICASCKKIRDDKGYWSQLENYIETHYDAAFSHSMCPECSDKLYGDEEWYIKMKKKKGYDH